MLRLSQIAARLGAELRGADGPIEDLAVLESAGPAHLSLCGDRRQIDRLRATRAAGVLLPRRDQVLIDIAPCAVLLVDDVRLALARALLLFHPPQPPEPGLAAEALVAGDARLEPGVRVEPGARIGAEARIGARSWIECGAVVAAGARIGCDCRIGAGAVVLGCCRLGDRVCVGPGSVLGSEGFGFAADGDRLRRIPQVGSLEIEDDVELGANCTVDRGTLGATRIGAGTKIDNLVHVAHNVTIGRGVRIAAQTGLSGSVTVEDGSLLGGQVGVADHLTIGAGAQVGAKSGVGSHVPAGQRVAGYPAVEVGDWLASVFAWRRMRRFLERRRREDEER